MSAPSAAAVQGAQRVADALSEILYENRRGPAAMALGTDLGMAIARASTNEELTAAIGRLIHVFGYVAALSYDIGRWEHQAGTPDDGEGSGGG